MPVTLTERQRIPTSGARAVEPFEIDGEHYLAIAQLALDVAGQDPDMNGGDSDTDVLLLRRGGDGFVSWSTLKAPGGEDAEYFTIDGRSFLAVASIRTGRGPYDFATESQIFAWDAGRFTPFQAIGTFAAKQWKYWDIDGRHFLGLAQGLQLPAMTAPTRDSIVFEWDGHHFVEQQRIPSRWAYNWHPFRIGPDRFVGHAEHLGPSVLYRWDGDRLVAHQTLVEKAGRAFATFEQQGEFYLVVAGLAEAPRVMRWTGARFADVQALEGLGARELAVFTWQGRRFLLRVNFILGTPADPHPVLTSQVYEFSAGRLEIVAQFPTCGGTDVAVLAGTAGLEFVVSNSLSADLRFAAETVVYELSLAGG